MSDLDLDLALLRVDVFAPADLDEIRALLQRPDVSLGLAGNRDGHRIIEVLVSGRCVAFVHHDGRVQHLHPVLA